VTGRARGFFGVGVYHPKREVNVGGLWRTAALYEASFVFTVGRRYDRQASDTSNTALHVPLIHFDDVDSLQRHLPHGAPLVGVEMDPRARSLDGYSHPERAVYLLGAEDHGLPQQVIDRCHVLVRIDYPGSASMNVASAGTLVMHDRHRKQQARVPVGVV
jgi:tRNA G18 (ribose-2'-O)-methylase SpoU